MDGVLNVHKTTGPTSHDVVDQIRRLFGQKKVGHAGTLDPMASGVLVVCLGKATRVVEHLMATRKEYRAGITLGCSTDTQDSTGAVIARSDASNVTREAFEKAASGFVGRIEQVPPMVSAIKHQGKRLYKIAREGKTIERKPRKVDVYSIEVLAFEPGPRSEAEMLVECGSGTYIRTLCADIGSALGCEAHMSMLQRTKVGRFRIEDSVTLARLAEAKAQGCLETSVIGISDALNDLPAVSIGADDVGRVLHGMPVGISREFGPSRQDVRWDRGQCPDVRILGPDGELIGLGAIASEHGKTLLRPRKVLAEVN